MATLSVLSAGAAQAVVQKTIGEYQRDTGHVVQAEFGAVGTMKDRMLAGVPVDVIILTSALIDELTASGDVVPGSRKDLGKVGTGVAVRAGTPLPAVSDRTALRANILAASVLVCPDPTVATAGKIVMQMLERLGIEAQLRGRLRFFPNGYAAMNWLAAGRGHRQMGITQVTEILANRGVAYAGPLPGEFQAKATYSAGLTTRTRGAELAREFMARLTAPAVWPMLAAAGFEVSD